MQYPPTPWDDRAEAFRALGDPVRIAILHFLRDQAGQCCAVPGQVCACDIQARLGLAQPTVSHHMAVLLRAGLVTARKQGRWTFYALAPNRFQHLAASLDALAAPAHRHAA